MELIINSETSELVKVREFVRDFCVDIPKFSKNDERLEMIELGIHELVVNIIKHAYEGKPGKIIRILASADSHQLKFELFDHGICFKPETVPQPHFDGSREGGFGIYLSNQIFNKVEYIQNEGEGNRTILTLKTS